MGLHSAIDSPDPVSRVTPPSTTIANTSAQQTNSQVAIARLAALLSTINLSLVWFIGGQS